MDNKELKDKIIKLLNDDYVEDKLGEESPNISADAVESIADDIVNLLPIHDVSKRKHQITYDWGYINGYDDCNKGLPKRDDLGVYDD